MIQNMKRETLPFLSYGEWLHDRSQDLTSTESPALFDLSPYSTVFELHHAKKDGLVVPFKGSERMEKGKRLQEYVAQEVALEKGWVVTPFTDYIRIPEIRMGSSFDYKAVCPERGEGILEIKGVDSFIYKQSWSEEEIPAHIEIQARHQMLVSELPWICVAVATSTWDIQYHFFERDAEFEAGLLAANKKFWEDVDAGIAPRPDFYRDGDVVNLLYKNAGGEPENRTDDLVLEAMLSKFDRLKDEVSIAEKEKEATKFAIHSHLANAGGAYTERWKVTTGWTKSSPDKAITQEMVGTVIPGRKGYRQCLLADLTKKKG